jgi:neutral ceramidase
VAAVFDEYRVGVGIADVTGPAAGTVMMGYVNPVQITKGIHFRLRARAFIVQDRSGQRVVYVSADLGMIFGAVKTLVVEQLQALYGGLYTRENVMLSGIHTHSGPQGHSWHTLYNVAGLGANQANTDAIVAGIVRSISRAHDNLATRKGGRIKFNNGTLDNANINRSPSAYEYNPAAERALYPNNTDHNMTLLSFEDEFGNPFAAAAWFAVHGTSMNNTNHLISGDNKGTASYLFEKQMNGNDTLPGTGPFVALFGQTNEGDVSPNTEGPHCGYWGPPCDFEHSTCVNEKGQNRTHGCIARGPGTNMYESTYAIGKRQFEMAYELFNQRGLQRPLPATGVSYCHMNIDMNGHQVSANYTSTGKDEVTCPGAIGDATAAGTTDGAGDFTFVQGTNVSSGDANSFFNHLGAILSRPSEQQRQCQGEKPIFINTGEIKIPAEWTPNIVPIQMFRIGNFWLLAVPSEFTTMSGRRLRNTVRSTLVSLGVADEHTSVVIAGLSNEYSQYVTTYEEYGAQRYEGASTLFGPHTLAAYQQEFDRMTRAMAVGTCPDPGPDALDLRGRVVQSPSLVFSTHPKNSPYGTLITDAKAVYTTGDTVEVTFQAANPSGNYMSENSFFYVERYNGTAWAKYRSDGDWDTKFIWRPKLDNPTESVVTIEWAIDGMVADGKYRVFYQSYAPTLLGGYTKYYSAQSSTFLVVKGI